MSAAAIVVAASTSLCSSSSLMDAVFQLDDSVRATFLQVLTQSTGATYICLWSCLAPTSCLCSLDGYYQEEVGQPSSSSGSLAQRLFEEYKKSIIIVENNHSHIPGFAYGSNHPYIETREDELCRLATNNTQRQFYQEARIKIAVFMGCQSGEIELGFSIMPQVDHVQMQMRNLFPEDFARQEIFPHTKTEQQNPHSSSSSSLRSLSIDSPEYSSLLFNLPAATYISEPLQESPIDPIISQPQSITSAEISIPNQLRAMQALARMSNLQFPVPGSEDEAMTKAFLAVVSSPSSSTSSSQQQQQHQQNQANPRASAFRAYPSSSAPAENLSVRKRENPMKRAITYFRGLHLVRSREREPMGPRGTTTQLHHMMSERKRREKLNDSFHALKSLLPPGTKKDKASVLSTTREYLTSLKNQIEELRERNAALESQVSASKTIFNNTSSESILLDDRVDVRIRHIQEPTSTEDHRIIELQVLVRGECASLQLVIRILEFMRQLNNVHLVAMDSGTRGLGPDIVNRVSLRLRIEGNEWDESAFEEAVRRIVADVAQ